MDLSRISELGPRNAAFSFSYNKQIQAQVTIIILADNLFIFFFIVTIIIFADNLFIFFLSVKLKNGCYDSQTQGYIFIKQAKSF